MEAIFDGLQEKGIEKNILSGDVYCKHTCVRFEGNMGYSNPNVENKESIYHEKFDIGGKQMIVIDEAYSVYKMVQLVDMEEG